MDEDERRWNERVAGAAERAATDLRRLHDRDVGRLIADLDALAARLRGELAAEDAGGCERG